MSHRYRKLIDWAVPVILLVGLTIPFWVTDADVTVAERYYVPSEGFPAEANWRGARCTPTV